MKLYFINITKQFWFKKFHNLLNVQNKNEYEFYREFAVFLEIIFINLDNCDKIKLIFKDVPKSLKVEEMELIFENKRYVGKGDFEVEKISELNIGENKRDILLEYKSEKCK